MVNSKFINSLFFFIFCISIAVFAQKPVFNRISAGFSVNSSEDSARSYGLPNLLTLPSEQKVNTVSGWELNLHPEILSLIEKVQFGVALTFNSILKFRIIDSGSSAFHGIAERKQVKIYLIDTSLLYTNLGYNMQHGGPVPGGPFIYNF